VIPDSGDLVAFGPMLIAVPVAMLAGLVSFLSPCCLPLVPGYLACVTGTAGADAQAAPTPPAGDETSPRVRSTAVAIRPVRQAMTSRSRSRRWRAATGLRALRRSPTMINFGATHDHGRGLRR